MFTGIVEEMGVVEKVVSGPVMHIVIRAERVLEGTHIGDSICVDGVCLTVVSRNKKCLSFDVVKESQDLTTLNHLKAGDVVNLERALAVGQRLGGHFVYGHIDTVGVITSRNTRGNEFWIKVKIEEDLVRFLVPKGSVTLDGISLTLAEVSSDFFRAALIPHTLESTNLKYKQPGSLLNIEIDMLARYISRLLAYQQSRETKVNESYLREQGFDA